MTAVVDLPPSIIAWDPGWYCGKKEIKQRTAVSLRLLLANFKAPLVKPHMKTMPNFLICARCFACLRPLSHSATSSIFLRSFTTTIPIFAQAQRNSAQLAGFRVPSVVGMKKKKKREVPKRPMVGERRALRRRIVLSNTNALEVHGMRELSVDNMADPSHIGRMLRLDSGDLLDRLRHVRAFKTTQNWNMFRRPAVLVRKEFVEMGQTILDIKTSNSNGVAAGRPRTVRRIVTGEGGTGKSLMLLHAMSMAFLNDWIVIHVPEGMFVNW